MSTGNPYTQFGVVPREEATGRSGLAFLQDILARRITAPRASSSQTVRPPA